MINLTIPELKLLCDMTGKGIFSSLKHRLHLKFLSEVKDKIADEEHIRNNCGESIYFYYINYNDEYKFRVESMLVNPNKDTYSCAEYEFIDCHYVDIGVRKCDVLNTDFLKTLKLAKYIEDERQAKLDTIKEDVK